MFENVLQLLHKWRKKEKKTKQTLMPESLISCPFDKKRQRWRESMAASNNAHLHKDMSPKQTEFL